MSRWTPKGTSDWLAMWLPKLKPAQFGVLFALARYADSETGGCFPSLAALAEDIGMAESYVHRIIDELVDLGCIRKTPGSQGRGNSNTYALVDDPEGLEQFTAELRARRKARREKSEAAREHCRRETGKAKAAMRAAFHRNGARPEEASDGQLERHRQTERAVAFRRRVPEERPVYHRGREVLGDDARGLVAALLDSYGGDVEAALDTIACASEERDPRHYIEDILASRKPH
jgi:Helix-turn-helix domain